jgi:hypothetical protein
VGPCLARARVRAEGQRAGNPLHRLAKDLRAYFDGCRSETVWDLIKGAGHAREQAALTANKGAKILDWLAAHSQRVSAR